MDQHAAYIALNGKDVNEYILSISGVGKCEEEPGRDEITGSLSDTSERRRPSIPFTISAAENTLTDASEINELLRRIEDELDCGRSFVRLQHP
jgi:hypothetical protein